MPIPDRVRQISKRDFGKYFTYFLVGAVGVATGVVVVPQAVKAGEGDPFNTANPASGKEPSNGSGGEGGGGYPGELGSAGRGSETLVDEGVTWLCPTSLDPNEQQCLSIDHVGQPILLNKGLLYTYAPDDRGSMVFRPVEGADLSPLTNAAIVEEGGLTGVFAGRTFIGEASPRLAFMSLGQSMWYGAGVDGRPEQIGALRYQSETAGALFCATRLRYRLGNPEPQAYITVQQGLGTTLGRINEVLEGLGVNKKYGEDEVIALMKGRKEIQLELELLRNATGGIKLDDLQQKALDKHWLGGKVQAKLNEEGVSEEDRKRLLLASALQATWIEEVKTELSKEVDGQNEQGNYPQRKIMNELISSVVVDGQVNDQLLNELVLDYVSRIGVFGKISWEGDTPPAIFTFSDLPVFFGERNYQLIRTIVCGGVIYSVTNPLYLGTRPAVLQTRKVVSSGPSNTAVLVDPVDLLVPPVGLMESDTVAVDMVAADDAVCAMLIQRHEGQLTPAMVRFVVRDRGDGTSETKFTGDCLLPDMSDTDKVIMAAAVLRGNDQSHRESPVMVYKKGSKLVTNVLWSMPGDSGVPGTEIKTSSSTTNLPLWVDEMKEMKVKVVEGELFVQVVAKCSQHGGVSEGVYLFEMKLNRPDNEPKYNRVDLPLVRNGSK